MLTKELRELEKEGLVIRKVYPQVPPKVEYSLTETGQSLIPVLDQLCDRGSEHMGDDIEFQCKIKNISHVKIIFLNNGLMTVEKQKDLVLVCSILPSSTFLLMDRFSNSQFPIG